MSNSFVSIRAQSLGMQDFWPMPIPAHILSPGRGKYTYTGKIRKPLIKASSHRSVMSVEMIILGWYWYSILKPFTVTGDPPIYRFSTRINQMFILHAVHVMLICLIKNLTRFNIQFFFCWSDTFLNTHRVCCFLWVCVPDCVAAGPDELNDLLVPKSLHGGLVYTCDSVPCAHTHTHTRGRARTHKQHVC